MRRLCLTGDAVCQQVVLDLQGCLRTLLVRMTAVEVSLLQQPLLGGQFSASTFHLLGQVIVLTARERNP